MVAEGVEDMEHVRMLLAVGCDVMQGYGISARYPPKACVGGWTPLPRSTLVIDAPNMTH
jgi:EAL domain-containing protein (putative c-di-GMP-specific phosphodiesterase class I)